MDHAPAAAGGSRRRVDWSRAAQLLAQGHAAAEVARQLGCARTTIVKRLKKDPAFRAQIESRAPRGRSGNRLQALRFKVQAAIEDEVQAGNVRVILWLADRMKLIEPPDAPPTPQDELNRLIDGMSPEELVQFEQLRDTD